MLIQDYARLVVQVKLMCEEMTDGEMWEDHRLEQKTKRAHNRDQSTQILMREGIRFESKNIGAHLIVEGKQELIDFWPGTGKWNARKTKYKSRGVFRLLKYLRRTD